MDSKQLKLQLKKFSHQKNQDWQFLRRIDVTGLKTDCAAISRLLHSYGALAFWDYAAVGPAGPVF